jgi:hypothetical protein
MPDIPEVPIDELTDNVRSGMTDALLMEKYDLSSRALKDLFERLLDSRRIEYRHVRCRPVFWDESVTGETKRRLPRLLLAFNLPIYDADRPGINGTVVDVTERGMKVSGIEARPGETITFVMVPRKVAAVEPIEFYAQCRWASTDGAGGTTSAGFEITGISEYYLDVLREFLERITTEPTNCRDLDT